jgi:hypothetical protein
MRRAGGVFALAAALLGGAACQDKGPSSPDPAGEVVLAPGESARFQGLALTFDGVSGDSRCPIGVTCIWEGDAVVELTASAPPAAGQVLELHTAGQFPREGTHGGFRIALVSLTPHPRENQPVRPSQYRATLRVTTR